MSEQERGIFDGDAPVSDTFIFDGGIFDTQLVLPVAKKGITVFVHGVEEIDTLVHGNELIPRSLT